MAAQRAICHAQVNKIAAHQKRHLAGGIVFIVCALKYLQNLQGTAPRRKQVANGGKNGRLRSNARRRKWFCGTASIYKTPGSTTGQQTQKAVFFTIGFFYPIMPKPNNGERRK